LQRRSMPPPRHWGWLVANGPLPHPLHLWRLLGRGRTRGTLPPLRCFWLRRRGRGERNCADTLLSVRQRFKFPGSPFPVRSQHPHNGARTNTSYFTTQC
jgi:hypothetical protein